MRVLINQRYRASFRKDFFVQLTEKGVAEFFFVFGTADSRDYESVRQFGDEVNVKAMFCKYHGIFNGFVQWQSGIAACLRAIKPDVVVITPTPRVVSNFLWVLFCYFCDLRIIGWGMGEMPGRKGWRRKLHQVFQALLIRRLDAVICYSSNAVNYYSSMLPHRPVTWCPNTVDVEATAELARQARFRKKKSIFITEEARDISEHPYLQVLVLGRVTREKKLDDLLHAIPITGPVEVNVVGECQHIRLRRELDSLAIQRDIKIRWLGHQAGKFLADIVTATDVMVLPGRGGLAINHAMAHGVPVICSVADGTETDLVIDGETGFLFEEGNLSDLTVALSSCCKDREMLRRLGRQAQAHVIANFSAQLSVNAFIKGLKAGYDV